MKKNRTICKCLVSFIGTRDGKLIFGSHFTSLAYPYPDKTVEAIEHELAIKDNIAGARVMAISRMN